MLQGSYDYRLVALSVGIVAIGIAFVQLLLATRREAAKCAQEGEARFRNLATAIPQTIWTASADGAVDYFNSRWFELTGVTEEQSFGWGWKQAIHPDDLPVFSALWEKSLREGSPFEMEYRVRNASLTYRWHLARAIPVRDASGAIMKWFGASTDIEEQKQALQAL